MNQCQGPECSRQVVAKGLCAGHYTQQRKGKPLTVLRRYKAYPSTPPEGYWFCTTCQNFKPLDQFYARKNGGLYTDCKECSIRRTKINITRREAA